MSNPELITTENNNDEEKEPESSSRMISTRELAEYQKNAEDKKQKKNEKNEEEDKFIIEEEYLTLDECTAMTLGPETIFQKCRSIAKTDPKLEEFKWEKEFACFCGNKLKHRPELPQKREQKICDLIVLDQSLEVGLFFCETHQLSICCVCSVECHKRCQIRKAGGLSFPPALCLFKHVFRKDVC